MDSSELTQKFVEKIIEHMGPTDDFIKKMTSFTKTTMDKEIMKIFLDAENKNQPVDHGTVMIQTMDSVCKCLMNAAIKKGVSDNIIKKITTNANQEMLETIKRAIESKKSK